MTVQSNIFIDRGIETATRTDRFDHRKGRVDVYVPIKVSLKKDVVEPLENFLGPRDRGITYLKPGPVMSGQPVMVQNSDIVP